MKTNKSEIKKNQIKEFFENNFNKLVLRNQLIPKSEVEKLWPEFAKWYLQLMWNTSVYPLETLKKDYNLLKESSKRRYFFLKNYSKLVRNNTLIPYTEIKNLGPEFYSWYCSLQMVNSWNYTIKDLMKEFSIEIPYLKPKIVKNITKDYIREFFEKNKSLLVENWCLKSPKDIKALGSEFVNWFSYLTAKKDGYSFDSLYKEYNIKSYEFLKEPIDIELIKEQLLKEIKELFKENNKFWLVCWILPWTPFLLKKLTGNPLENYKLWISKINKLKRIDSAFDYSKFIKKMWYLTASSANTSFHS